MNSGTEVDKFCATWQPCAAKRAFEVLYQTLRTLDQVKLNFKARPGITYSLRGSHPAHDPREFFVLIDIIDDDPEQRWLSVCFYNNMVTDPQKRGDWIPQGIFGQDARCFDVDELDDDFVAYVAERIKQAAVATITR